MKVSRQWECYLKNGADPNLASSATKIVPLSIALSLDLRAADLLIKYGANVDYQHPETGQTHLHAMAHITNCKAIALLLQSGADKELVDNTGKKPDLGVCRDSIPNIN